MPVLDPGNDDDDEVNDYGEEDINSDQSERQPQTIGVTERRNWRGDIAGRENIQALARTDSEEYIWRVMEQWQTWSSAHCGGS
jgi:hypothetical protein